MNARYRIKMNKKRVYHHSLQSMQQHQPMEEEHKEPVNFGRFAIFLLAKSAQTAYGVRTGDYARYRRYCTRKVEKLRSTMHYKYGNKTKFNKKDITQDKADDQRVLQVALYTCEKYWGYANQCKFAQTIKQEHKLRARFQAIKKFRRAFQWASKLLNLCKQTCDSVTSSEAEAYCLFMEGLFLLEKQEWKTAQARLIGCREIIKDLVGSVDSMSGKIYKEKIDQIDQTIKFCNFKISKGKEMPIEQIVEMLKVGDPSLSNLIQNITERRMNQLSVNSANELRFGDEHYTMKNDKIIMQKNKIDEGLQNLQIIKKKALVELGDEQLYEELLNFFSNVIILVDEAIKLVDTDKEDTKNTTQGEVQVLKKVSVLFEKIKLNIFIDRNFTIFKHSYQSDKGRKSAPQTLAKLLSNTITVYTQLIEVEKLINEGTDLAPEKIRQIDACIFFVRTIRLSLVGKVYYNNGKIKEAYNLWNECERCLQTVKNSKEAMSLDFVDFQKVRQQTKVLIMKCVIENYKATEGNSKKMTEEMKEMRIDEEGNQKHSEFTLYDLITGKISQKQADLTLADYGKLEPIDLPGRIQPIPTRPIFYDIFFTELEYPSLESKMQKTQQKGWWGKLFGK